MKVKFISTLIFVSVAIVIPLLGALKLLLSPQIGILLVSCIILLLSQPPITLKKSLQLQKTDKLSVLMIMIGSAICINVSVLEWSYWQINNHVFRFDKWTISGIFLISGGILFRLWAIRTLGKFFTSEVKVQDDQKIIQTGPYGLIRHPSYLGAYMAMIGCPIFLHTTIGLIVTASLMLIASLYRINVEEQTLVDEFGPVYRQYQEKTRRLIPFIY